MPLECHPLNIGLNGVCVYRASALPPSACNLQVRPFGSLSLFAVYFRNWRFLSTCLVLGFRNHGQDLKCLSPVDRRDMAAFSFRGQMTKMVFLTNPRESPMVLCLAKLDVTSCPLADLHGFSCMDTYGRISSEVKWSEIINLHLVRSFAENKISGRTSK